MSKLFTGLNAIRGSTSITIRQHSSTLKDENHEPILQMGDKFVEFLEGRNLEPIIENKVKNCMSKKLGRFLFHFFCLIIVIIWWLIIYIRVEKEIKT